MSSERDRIEKILQEVETDFDMIKVEDIPHIDLYMDQVLTFMSDQLEDTVRDPEKDKVLTKTMINNYVKNKVLIPPVKKKYGTDHIILLMLIYYMKNFLAIDDIHKIMEPVVERYAQAAVKPQDKSREDPPRKKREYTLSEIYTMIFDDTRDQVDRITGDIAEKYASTEGKFEKAPEAKKEMLRRFDLILQLCADIYIKKMFIEKLVDDLEKERESASPQDKKRK